GDILKYVNVVRSKDHSFSDFFKILATMKKPVLLRFERISASTPSSDEDEASQLFGVHRSSSTNAVNSASHYARQNVPNPDEGDPTGKFQRANSVPQKDQKPPKATRGAFWRAPSAKDSVGPGNPAQSVGPSGMNGGNDRMAASQGHRRAPSNRDHQVSPRDAVAANGTREHASHSPLGPHEYQVYWETGSLGLFFGEDRATNLPVVTRSTPSANPVVRRAVAVNDTLVSANGIKRSRNSSEEQRPHQPAAIPVHDEEPVLSPVSKTTHLSPTEPWDLPEHIPSPTIKAEPFEVDEDDDVDVGVPVSPTADSHLDHAVMAEEAELAEEVELDEAEIAEEAELIEEAELVDEAELAEMAEEAELAEEVEEAEPALPSHPVVNLSEDDVEVGMLADVEVGIAVEETDSEVVESSTSESDQNPWDLEPESKTHHHDSKASSSTTESSSIVETSKVDFTDAPESSDEFSSDPDMSSDIDIVDGDIMMQEAPKDKVDVNPPKPSKSSLNANLAKYKKKGKTSRGVIKLPALTEEEALTVPLVAPNAVNTTVQVRGRPKPKLTMADTPDSTTYLIKWKENRSIGLQLKEVRFAKGTYPLVTDVCQEPCCELLRHICVGDVIIEINGRNTSTMGVKKTVNFLKTCTKTTLMKIRHGPGFVNQRVSATV
ncbi:hypothetical protein JG687_00010889, partial [Phytophthora cactorum]